MSVLPRRQVQDFSGDSPSPHFSTSQRDVNRRKIQPRRKLDENLQPRALLPNGCKEWAFLSNSDSCEIRPHNGAFGTIRYRRRLGKERSDLLILEGCSLIRIPRLVLDRSETMGEQPGLCGRLRRLRTPRYTALRGMPCHILSSARSFARRQRLQQEQLRTGNFVRAVPRTKVQPRATARSNSFAPER